MNQPKPMTPRAARALAIRDHVMPLVRANGKLEPIKGGIRVVTWNSTPWMFMHRTPFGPLPSSVNAPSYAHTGAQQQATGMLPYGLDIWRGAKVLSIQWDEAQLGIVTFKRGDWEDELLCLAAIPTGQG